MAGGAALVVGAALVAAAVFAPGELPGRVLLIAGVVGGYAAVVADLRAVAAVTALGAATFVGFLANRYGELTGAGDAWSHAVLIGFAAVLGTGYRYVRSINLDHDDVPGPPLRRVAGPVAVVAPPDRSEDRRAA
ncbi:hypothetical protein CO540_16575 [Micromonospora sp. WMMA2032]|uniref:hypothetical protein n=1 Tax=Micromonospora TaxID=1873 RepID=UPI000C05AC62|nr:hypothetical protein [Micromonospora sp. WMMA2032]ATO15252.1 hypothetical protein CO540_16575 [Micromonospora sp. WMMA2032]